MNKSLKLWLIFGFIAIVIIVVVTLIVVLKLTSKSKNDEIKKYKYADLSTITIVTSGGENGEYYSYEIARLKDGKTRVVYKHKDYEDDELVTEEYTFTSGFLHDLQQNFANYKLFECSNTKADFSLRPTDAPETNYTFTFNDLDTISFSQYQVTKEKYAEGIQKINKAIDLYINLQKETPEPGLLKSVKYSYAGDMIGSYEEYSITLNDNNVDCTRYEEIQPEHSAKPHISKTTIDRTNLDKIYLLFKENNLETWNDLPLSEEFVLDAGTSYYKFVLLDGTEISFNSNDEWPDGSYEAIREILKILKEK